ncbi:lipoate-protein ligase A [Fervidobacterium changbaicum]|uniref:Lipoate--protein ligase family protein n=1 Tax=Fervidobacterium changbaicum TaxID=310769 RepID=A0ABX5QSI7_9BACT|nr:biotin/lipoate A/B protein ligase family protein [Fervidobacterium changbaicum]QAV33356.1 lipoate--protein ligase family protein [Fervidobacterium changbaicum]SDG89627.1 lipoate-protein ligase A [Fervidobacterium changbaicum]
MYIFETYGFKGSKNMAIDVTLGQIANELNDAILRFYTWEVPTLSLGKHQKADDVDFEYIEKNGFDLVRRPSGGRAVLHWDEVTYSIVIPNGHELFKYGVLELYNLISKIIVNGLNRLGYPVELTEGKNKPVSHVCFQVPSTYEITLNGIKVVGSAQTRTQDYILQHGSIVLIPHEEIKHCFRSTKTLDIPLIGLYNYARREFSEIVKSLKESFEDYFGDGKEFDEDTKEKILENSRVLEERFLVRKPEVSKEEVGA